jgi:putative spermidine/putrescine transport system ATP-binding protein
MEYITSHEATPMPTSSSTVNPAQTSLSAMPLVRFSGVQKTYDGTQLVVRDLNLEIQSGEFLTLLGPSGSGKTTTLMMLAGFESPTSGEIFLSERAITRTPPHKRNFGMVFQNYALFPHMTVEQNVAYPLTVRNVPKAQREERVARALDSVQLRGKNSQFPAQLSGGQQQRVALARAMVFEPQLVLMDEPLGALDKQLREHMQIELKELHKKLGVTFVYVTHDQSEALTMSDRVAVFNDGIIQQLAPVLSLYETPANRFVAGFVGDNTPLKGQCGSTEGGLCEVTLPGAVTRCLGVNVNTAHNGAEVVASVRPERIVVYTQSPLPELNVFKAVLADLLYFGDHLRLRCVMEGQGVVTVKLPLSSVSPPERGDVLWLHVAPEHLRVYL